MDCRAAMLGQERASAMGLPSICQGYDTGEDPRLWGVPYSKPHARQGFLTSELQLCLSSMRHHSLTPGGSGPPRARYGNRDSPLLGLVGLGPKLSIFPEPSCCPTAGEETGAKRLGTSASLQNCADSVPNKCRSPSALGFHGAEAWTGSTHLEGSSR